MRRVSIIIAVCFALAVGLSVAGQAPRDLDAIMKEVGPIWATPQTGLGARGGQLDAATPDTAKIATDAGRLQTLFTEAQAGFTKLNMAEAATMAKAAADAAGALAKEAKTGKLADAKASKASINCGGCHQKYRGKDPSGNFILQQTPPAK
jgi:cytochrome c556